MGFLDNLLGDGKNKSDKGKPSIGIPNPFARQQSFQGQGQSLGGSKPGIVIPISLPQPGPLGVRVEKRPNSEGTAIVNEVIPGSQAEAAGLKRGDILCFGGSNGQEEMHYDMFLELARSDQRPLEFEIRRITVKTEKPVEPTAKAKSAEVDHRRQAVIAAAEAREKAHKAKSKPIKLVTKTTLARQQQEQEQQSATLVDDTPKSEQAKRAAEAAKQGEAALAQQLGYNPYEPARSTAGQARNATVTAQHGSLSAPAPSIPAVAPPTVPVESVIDEEDDSLLDVPSEFQEALTTMVSASPPDLVQSTCGIIKKLVLNAITKGQTPNEDASKFRKVRLANPKIKATLVDVPGALEVMLSTGFVLEEHDGESVLVFPPDCVGPDWLPSAMKQLDLMAAGQ